PTPRRFARAMRGVLRLDGLRFGAQQSADGFAKTVAAIADREEIQLVVRAHLTPTAGDGGGGFAGGQCALELVGRDQNLQGHGPNFNRPTATRNLKLRPEIAAWPNARAVAFFVPDTKL